MRDRSVPPGPIHTCRSCSGVVKARTQVSTDAPYFARATRSTRAGRLWTLVKQALWSAHHLGPRVKRVGAGVMAVTPTDQPLGALIGFYRIKTTGKYRNQRQGPKIWRVPEASTPQGVESEQFKVAGLHYTN